LLSGHRTAASVAGKLKSVRLRIPPLAIHSSVNRCMGEARPKGTALR
jgi:hypothetical protein